MLVEEDIFKRGSHFISKAHPLILQPGTHNDVINVIAILLSWQRPEGSVQVFLLIFTWLVAAFGHKTREDWKKLVILYDNMCHISKVA